MKVGLPEGTSWPANSRLENTTWKIRGGKAASNPKGAVQVSVGNAMSLAQSEEMLVGLHLLQRFVELFMQLFQTLLDCGRHLARVAHLCGNRSPS